MECSTNARHGQCTRFPVVAAAPFPFLFHRTGIGGVHGDVYRFHPPPGGTDGVRNVDRRRSGRDLAPFPRPPILLRNPLGRAAGRPDPGHPGHGNTARTQRGDHARYRRNTHPPAGTEGVRCVLVARRLRGERIGTPTDIANHATKNNTWVDTLINRYGTTITAQTCEITGLWFGVWRTDPVRVILVKDSHRKATARKGYDIAIVRKRRDKPA